MEALRAEFEKSWHKVYEVCLSGNSTAVFEMLKEDKAVLQSVVATVLLGVLTLLFFVICAYSSRSPLYRHLSLCVFS